MKYEQLVEIMEKHGALFSIEQLDKDYKLVDERWWREEFLPSFERWLADLGLLTWRPEAGDCDDLAWWAGGHARACQARLKEPKALAIGMFNYLPDAGGKHSVPFAIVTSEGGEPRLRFADRKFNQLGNVCIQEVILSQSEVESCCFWLA